MIEFALLFGLGFLTAAFLGFLIAPAVHRRIVWFTENRMKATMPLSPQEVRAQKDMARALYAAENAKTAQDLQAEREKTVALQIRHDTIAAEAGRLSAENADIHAQMNEMNVEAGDLRSRLRREENYISQLKASLHVSEQAVAAKDGEIDKAQKRLNKLASDVDNLRIDIAAREAEIESTKFRVNSLRDERDTLRQDVNLLMKRAKEAEMRLTQEEHKVLRLDDKLNREIAANADKDMLIERRLAEIAKLKDKVKSANTEAREATRALRQAGLKPSQALKSVTMPKMAPLSDISKSDDMDEIDEAQAELNRKAEIARLTDDVRNRNATLADGLQNARTPAHEEALREELAMIAANMVALTALRERKPSPIMAHIGQKPAGGKKARLSLADRVSELLPEQNS